jgi:6-phosphofructokinase 1
MGRTCGWIATYAGIAAGADAILVPEEPYDLDAVADLVRARAARGRRYSVVVVAEGIVPPLGAGLAAPLDAFGFERLGGVAAVVAAELERRTGFEARVTVLGHIQRGGTPTATDRVLGSRFGVAAADLAVTGTFGRMIALRGVDVVDVPLEVVRGDPRGVPATILDVARALSTP